MNPMRILIRLVLNRKFLEIISRCCATLSAIGCTSLCDLLRCLAGVRHVESPAFMFTDLFSSTCLLYTSLLDFNISLKSSCGCLAGVQHVESAAYTFTGLFHIHNSLFHLSFGLVYISFGFTLVPCRCVAC